MTTFAIYYMKPEFFRDGIMGTKWLAKHGRSCAHLREPAPAYLAFGNPRVLCSTCLDFYQAGISGTPADRRYDLCGEQILTPTLAPLIVEVGPLRLMGGACRDCRDTDD